MVDLFGSLNENKFSSYDQHFYKMLKMCVINVNRVGIGNGNGIEHDSFYFILRRYYIDRSQAKSKLNPLICLREKMLIIFTIYQHRI